MTCITDFYTREHRLKDLTTQATQRARTDKIITMISSVCALAILAIIFASYFIIGIQQ